jgi:peptidyl-prolyl cis-trans isomerase C
MQQLLKQFIRQPLVHFLLIGALLFALYYAVNPDTQAKDTIVIDDEQVGRIVTVFEKEWNRPPTEAEMKGLLEKFIQQEVYYRKALLMNLDHNDEIIRRRLDQKLRFITNDMATLKEPNEKEMLAYYQTNKHKYLTPKKYSFSHIYFSPDHRANASEDAKNLLLAIRTSKAPLHEMIKKGDPFPFAYHMEELTAQEIAQQLGDGFISGLQQQPAQQWSGPIFSGYGVHLVFIDTILQSVEPQLASIRNELIRDYQYSLQEQYNTQLLNEFRKDFIIKLDIKEPARKNQLSQLVNINEAR